jgi:hypothetical protein
VHGWRLSHFERRWLVWTQTINIGQAWFWHIAGKFNRILNNIK